MAAEDVCMMILEYAAKFQHIEVFHVLYHDQEQTWLPDNLRIPAMLSRIVSCEDLGRFEEAASLLDQLYQLTPTCIPFEKYSRLSLGIKMKLLIQMLRMDVSSALAMLNKLIPKEGFSFDTQDKQGLTKMNSCARDFRRFYLPLLLERDQRDAYFNSEYHREFGGPYMERLKKLTKSVISMVMSSLPPCPLELLASQNPETPRTAQNRLTMKLLVNFIKVKQKPDEDALVQLLKLLYYQDQIPGRARAKLAKLVMQFRKPPLNRVSLTSESKVPTDEGIPEIGNETYALEKFVVKKPGHMRVIPCLFSQKRGEKYGSAEEMLDVQDTYQDKTNAAGAVGLQRYAGQKKVKGVNNTIKDSGDKSKCQEFHVETFYAKRTTSNTMTDNSSNRGIQVLTGASFIKSLRCKKIRSRHQGNRRISQVTDLSTPRKASVCPILHAVCTRSRKRKSVEKENEIIKNSEDLSEKKNPGKDQDQDLNKPWIRRLKTDDITLRNSDNDLYRLRPLNALSGLKRLKRYRPLSEHSKIICKVPKRSNTRGQDNVEAVYEVSDSSDKSPVIAYTTNQPVSKHFERSVSKVTRWQKANATFLGMTGDTYVSDTHEDKVAQANAHPSNSTGHAECKTLNLCVKHNYTALVGKHKSTRHRHSAGKRAESLNLATKSEHCDVDMGILRVGKNKRKLHTDRFDGNRDKTLDLETDETPQVAAVAMVPMNKHTYTCTSVCDSTDEGCLLGMTEVLFQGRTGERSKLDKVTGAPDDVCLEARGDISYLFRLEELPKCSGGVTLIDARWNSSETFSIVPPSVRSEGSLNLELDIFEKDVEFEDNTIPENIPDIRKFLQT